MDEDVKLKNVPHTILMVEDDTPDAALVSRKIRDLWPDCNIVLVQSMKAAYMHSKEHGIDMVLLDLNVPDASGSKTVQDAKQFIKIPIIVMTGMVQDDAVVQALKNGANNIVAKRDVSGEGFVNILEQNTN